MRFTLKNLLRWSIWTISLGVIISYAFYRSQNLREGSIITLSEPKNGETYTTPLIHVRGTAMQAKELYLNDRGIFIDLEGHFNEELLLLPGYNIIELTAKDTSGKEVIKTVELTYLPSAVDLNQIATSTSSQASTSTHSVIK